MRITALILLLLLVACSGDSDIGHEEVVIKANQFLEDDPQEAILYCDKLLNAGKESPKCELLLVKGKALVIMKKYEAALPYLKKASSIQECQLNEEIYGDNYYQLGLAYFNLGDNDSATHYFVKSTQLLQIIGSSLKLGHAYNMLGLSTEEGDNLPEAIKNYELALTTYKEIENAKGKANVYHNLGNTYAKKADYKTSTRYFSKALKIRLLRRDSVDAAKTLSNLAVNYIEMGKYENSLIYFNRAIQILKNSKEQKALGNCLTNMGAVYHSLNQYRDALKYYKKALSLFKNLENEVGIAYNLNNVGGCYESLLELDSALLFYTKSFQIKQQLGDSLGMAVSMANMGDLYVNQKKYDQAIVSLNGALKIQERFLSLYGQVQTLKSMAKCYSEMNESDVSIQKLEKALAIAQNIDAYDYIKEVSLQLSQQYKMGSRFEKALSYHTLYSSYNDSLLTNSRIQSLNENNLGLEVIAYTNQITALNAELVLLRKKSTIISIVAVSLIIIMVSIFLVSNNRKNKEILTYANLKDSLSGEIELLTEQLQKQDLDNRDDKKEEEIRIVKILTPEDWDKFKKTVEKQHPNYFIKLKSFLPELTTSEQRLTALLKLGLNNKEISEVLGISIDSVYTTRYRLRKKLASKNVHSITDLIKKIA